MHEDAKTPERLKTFFQIYLTKDAATLLQMTLTNEQLGNS